MNKLLSKFAAVALIAVASFTPGYAQTNLGASCGCLTPVSSRPTVLVSTLAASGGATDGELVANTTFDCNHTYILDKKIYVPSGKTLTINPGTVIKGNTGTAANATCLVVEVGGKINATGTPTCQIVFTAAADNLDGTFPIASNGQWGGVLIAGKASNNLTLAANGPFDATGNGKLCVADGIGTFEGFASTNTKDQFGVTPASFDDNDNSGTLKYVSIRHAGAILVQGGEINGLSLGSVGRGTTIEHLEIVSSADDGIELWGGTVNLKYISTLFGNDDNIDWDCGWRGNAQFLFTLKTDASASVDADNGFEMDADDQKSGLLPRSHPVIYNATMIGNSKTTLTSDNSGLSAIEAKELTEGEIYNSVFANWRYGLNLIKSLGTRTSGTSESYHNWSNFAGNGSNTLKIKCNTFTGILTKTLAIDKNAGGATTIQDSLQFFAIDNNNVITSIPGFSSAFTVNNTTNAVTVFPDPIPTPALSIAGCPVSSDPFFTTANYRGAFAPNGSNWLSDWSYASVLGVTSGFKPACVTDLNGDGVTDNIDFLQVLGQYNQVCP